MQYSKLDLQFLASFINNPNNLSLLDKEVSVNDFDDPVYYDIYSEVMNFVINKKVPTYSDLKFKLQSDRIMLDILSQVEQQAIIDDLSIVYNELCEQTRKKRLSDIGKKLYNSAKTQELSSSEIVSVTEQQLLQVVLSSESRASDIIEATNDFETSFNEKVKRYRKFQTVQGVLDISTGISSLDLYTLGMQKGNTWVLGGGTSDGKSQIAIQITNHLMTCGHRVLYLMLEDTKENLIYRLLSLRNKVKINNLLIGNVTTIEEDKIKKDLNVLKQLNNLHIEDEINDINDILAIVQFTKLKYPDLGVVFLDHINLITDRAIKRSANREQEIGGASKKLVSLAKKLDINITILQQLNTNPDERTKGLPVTVNDLRDCKSTSHDSTVTLLINCPNKYNKDENFSKKHIQLILAKNRYGECNKILEFTNKASIGRLEEGAPKPIK